MSTCSDQDSLDGERQALGFYNSFDFGFFIQILGPVGALVCLRIGSRTNSR